MISLYSFFGFSPFLARIAVVVVLGLALGGCEEAPAQDSGGKLSEEQAAYDVTYYDLALTVAPAQTSISGRLTVRAAVKDPLEVLVLNLDHRLDVHRAWHPASETADPLSVERRADGNELWIKLAERYKAGDTVEVAVEYGGQPRVAPQPPWDGGFTWATTPSGAPWVATSCQTAGADLWWPVKDHPSDEPDSMDLAFTVPDSLVAASNGRLQSVEPASDSTRTFRWHVSTPINTYGVTLNVAPYVAVDTTYTSTAGTDVPVTFYALPSDRAQAQSVLPHFLDQVRFLEETLGPYPFREDKYGVAQTPFLGMEHQTLIAYGNNFDTSGGLGYDVAFDALHFHELAHEWYGNCLTVQDWKDFWLHEGFATYLEALYAESLQGPAAYHRLISYYRDQLAEQVPIARRKPASAQEVYHRDVYYKGALILHTLRSVLGEETFRTLLRRFVHPGRADAPNAAGGPCRHVTTEDFIRHAEAVSDRQLEGIIETYLYRESLPRLDTTRTNDTLHLEWTNTATNQFSVPVEVQVADSIHTVSMDEGKGSLALGDESSVTIDPKNWLLRAGAANTPSRRGQ